VRSASSPLRQPERARRRRDVVLRAMLDNGMVAPDSYSTAVAADPRIEEASTDGTFAVPRDERAPSSLYFIDDVRRQLNMRFGEGAVLRGGLRVYTTLDPGLQRAAEDAVTGRLAELD